MKAFFIAAIILAGGAGATTLPGCDSNSSSSDDFVITYKADFDAAALVPTVTNAYFPLAPGTVYRMEGETEDGLEVDSTWVLAETRQVAGANARVVLDKVFLNGSLIEETYDWYAQDAAGNVWYLGEDSKAYRNGSVVSTAGSWETGVNGAVAGIIMPASPAAGQAYQQEYAKGEAEDRARVVNLEASVTVVSGTYSDCVKTEDTTPLVPEVVENKYYCAGVGVVLEVDVESNDRFELSSIIRPE